MNWKLDIKKTTIHKHNQELTRKEKEHGKFAKKKTLKKCFSLDNLCCWIYCWTKFSNIPYQTELALI